MTLWDQPCPKCGGEVEIRLLSNGVHYAERRCIAGNHFCGFEPKPDSDASKYRRPNEHREMVKKFSRGYCELCLTKECELPKGRTIEAHHVVEFQDGGQPTRENTWIVCTGCHRLIHWVRTYQGNGREAAEDIQNVAESMTRWHD